jgi:hypothetical protein
VIDTLTVAFRDAGGSVAWVHLPWVRGRRVRDYLRDPRLRKYSLVQQARKKRVVNQDGRKLRLTDRPGLGDIVGVGGVR